MKRSLQLVLTLVCFEMWFFSGNAQEESFSDASLRESYICYDLAYAVSNPDTVVGLNLRQQGYKELPASIGNLYRLEFINAMKNSISVIDPQIGELSQLRICLLYTSRRG